jgi:hypothetical protein
MLLKKSAWLNSAWAKIKTGAEWLAAGIVLGLGFAVWWRRPRAQLKVISNPAPVQPKPLPKTQAEVDAELKHLKLLK